MFEQFDAEPAFDYYPSSPFHRPSYADLSSVDDNHQAWGNASAAGSFSFASFSGLAEQLFGGDDAAGGFGGGASSASSSANTNATVRPANSKSSSFLAYDDELEHNGSGSGRRQSHPMQAELSAFTTTTDGYDSYGPSCSSAGSSSWSPSPLFATSALPLVPSSSSGSATPVHSSQFAPTYPSYDPHELDLAANPTSASYAGACSPLAPPTADDESEWYHPSSSATLSTKSSFESFASGSSAHELDDVPAGWDYYGFERADDTWGAPGPIAPPRVVQADDNDDEGAGFEQWVVPEQLHLPYAKPLPPSTPAPAPMPSTIDPSAQRALLRKQASDRSLARQQAARSVSLSAQSPVASTLLVGWSPAPPAPVAPVKRQPALRRKAGASSLKSSFQALAQLNQHHPQPQQQPAETAQTYGLVPLAQHVRSPFSPPAPHSQPYHQLPSPGPSSPPPMSYPCTPPSIHPYASSPPPAPRAIRRLPATVNAVASSSTSSGSGARVSPKPKPKRSKPLFGSTFINFTMDDARELLGGVAPSGNLKKPVVQRRSRPATAAVSGGGGKRKRSDEAEDDGGEQARGGKRSR